MVAAAVIGSAVIGVAGSAMSASSASSAANHGADAQADANKYAADIQKQIFEEQRNDLAPYRNAGNAALGEITALNGLAPPTAATSTGAFVLKGPNGIAQPLTAAQATQIKATGGLPAGYSITGGTTTPGQSSADQQQAALGRFQVSPGYQFAFDQGQDAITDSAAARGGVHSGAVDKALIRFGQGTANQEYGDYYNRLAAEAGIGQTATNAGNAAAQNYGNNASQLAQNTGAARASAYGQAGQAAANGYMGAASAIQGGIGNYLYMSQSANPYAAGGSMSPVTVTPSVYGTF